MFYTEGCHDGGKKRRLEMARLKTRFSNSLLDTSGRRVKIGIIIHQTFQSLAHELGISFILNSLNHAGTKDFGQSNCYSEKLHHL